MDYPFENFDAYDTLSKANLNRARTKRHSDHRKADNRNSARYSMGSISRSSGSFVSAVDSFNDNKFDR